MTQATQLPQEAPPSTPLALPRVQGRRPRRRWAVLALAAVTLGLPAAATLRPDPDSTAAPSADMRAGVLLTAGCSDIDAPVGPEDLVRTTGGLRVHPCLAPAVDALVADAARDGVRLSGTGWRSTEAQRELRRRNCGTSRYAVEEMPMHECAPPTARPGESRHEWGLAVDFEGLTPRSAAAEWMSRNAARYGLYNLAGEPWHWSFDGQ